MRARVLLALDESASAPTYYTAKSVDWALNEAQRFFALLTLCLEATRPFVLTPGARFYKMLPEWPDWIAPLRVRLSNDLAAGLTAEYDAVGGDQAMYNEQQYAGLAASAAPKLTPSTLTEMAAADAGWLSATGYPDRYTCLGFDLVALNRAPAIAGVKLLITYARSPVAMVEDTDVPEITEGDHLALVDGAVPLMRLKDGGQELAAALPLLGRFLEAAKQRALQVRARSLAQRYDKLPLELERVDLSRLMKLRPDLPPNRKAVPLGG